MSELKPCPFCGKEVTVIDYDDYGETCCVVCNFNNGDCGGSGGYRHTKEEAIETWNRRAEDGT